MNLVIRLSNYITRYAPSERKLREYIGRKSHTGDISTLLKEIGYSESMMCDMWMQTFLSTTKGPREIREKLSKKGFPKRMIEEKIEKNLSDIQNWENHKSEIESKIDALIQRGKSQKTISITLVGKFPYFRDEIRELIDEKSDSLGLKNEIEKYLLKYDISDFSKRAKFYAAIQRKGFGYREIQDFLDARRVE